MLTMPVFRLQSYVRLPRRVFLIVACTLSLTASSAFAQMESATVLGRITDQSGAVLSGAEVELRDVDTNVAALSSTNAEGFYAIHSLHPGRYVMSVRKQGFKAVSVTNINLNVQDNLVRNFALQIGAVSESITVAAESEKINTADASVSTVVDRRFVENTPLNGRSFQDLIALTPGVVTQNPQTTSGASAQGIIGDFSVNGQRTESNYYMVDGVTGNVTSGLSTGGPNAASSGSVGATTALGTTQSLISIDALQEFRVQSSTYSAEYGHSPGAQLSFVTRSGTKDLHGSLFDYLRNDYFDANDWFNNFFGKAKPALRQNDFGGTFGGPVFIPGVYSGKDRTFFFVSYEGLRLTQPQAATIQFVPDTFLRQNAPTALQPILNAFPVQSKNGVDFGNGLAQFIEPYSLPSAIDSASIRLDHNFSPRLSLFFRFGDTPSYVTSRALSSLLKSRINAQTYTLGATSLLSTNIYNELRLLYATGNSTSNSTLDSFGGATPIDLGAALGTASSPNPISRFVLNVPGTGVAILGTQVESNRGRQWNLVDTVTFSSGPHRFKLGIDDRRIKTRLTPASPFVQPIFIGQQSVMNNAANITILLKTLPAAPIFNETSIFVQDEWRITPRLNLSLGLRWEVKPPPTDAHGNDPFTVLGNTPSSLTLAPRGTPLWKTAWYNFAPRLGVAWVARARSGWDTVLRGGGGVFFDSDNQIAATGFDFLGFTANRTLGGTPVPVTAAQLSFSPSVTPPYGTIIAFPPHLQLPYTIEWNVSIQQALGKAQVLTITYLGANGRRLVQQQQRFLAPLNPNFSFVDFFQNGITSNYQALQLQFQRSVSRGVHALTSYTWSHCLDFGSTYVAFPSRRGNCDFDVRHNLQGGLSWGPARCARK